MVAVDKKIEEICNRKKFTTFWEVFDYMILANYEEVEAIMIGIQLFNGKIWDKVVYAEISGYADAYDDINCNTSFSGTTLTIVNGDVVNGDIGNDIPYKMYVKIFIMTEEADEIYRPVYKAYAETREYAPNEKLEKHIKVISTNLTTEIGATIFKDWYSKQ
jgi:hypothetical protein